MSRIELKSVSTSNNNEDDGNKPTRKRLKIETEPKVGSKKWNPGKIQLWEGFVIFSQFEASSLDRNRLNGWSHFDATSCWNPYSATMKQVAMYLHILESKHKLSSEERFSFTNQILQYIPHLKGEEMPKLEIEKYPDEIEIIFSAINKDEATIINPGQVTLTNTHKKSLRYNGAIWEDFVAYCSKLQEDPFLAQPHHIRQFIEHVFEEEAKTKMQNNFSPSLENYSSFYCANVVNICKHLGVYLKFEYGGGSLLASNPIKTLLSLFHCLDKKLVHPTGKVSKEDSNLMKQLIPKHWYANHQGKFSDFWKQKLVSEILMDVKNGVLTEGEAAWELGVTPDMLACAANRMKETSVPVKPSSSNVFSEPRQKSSRIKILEEKKAKIRQEASVDVEMEDDTQNISLTVKEYIEKGFGSEESFWKETSTEMLVDDVRNRVLDLDVAAFQLGTSSAKILEKVGTIKTAFEVHQEQERIREEKKKENRANATPKLTPLEYKIQLGENNEANLSEYEKMRLANMRERLSFLNNLEIEKDKKALKASIPVKPSPSKVFIEPRQKSSRLKILAEKKDKIRPEPSVDVEMDKISPEWVAKRTPRSSTYLMTDPTSQVSWKIIEENSQNLSLEELSFKIPIPKLTIAAEDLISRDSDYYKSTHFMQRLESEVNLGGTETQRGKTADISKWIQAGKGKVTNKEIISLAISEELIACGDAGGGLGFWLGERRLLLRPHHMAVCRTVFLGTGTSTRIATASHDGTVRVYDVSSQTFQLGFSWSKVYKHQQGVVWMEPLDETTWLLNCEGGDVLNVDKRDRKVAKLLCLPEARRSCQPQILFQTNSWHGYTGTSDRQISATPALVGSSISIHPVDRNLISLCDDETVVVYDRRNCGQPMFTIGTNNKCKNTSSTLNHHCGSGWNPTGNHFATYQRSEWSPPRYSTSVPRYQTKIMQGSVKLYSHSQLKGGDDPKSVGLANSKYEPVFSRGQGIVWSPWQDDIYYFVANTKPLLTNNWSNSVVAGVDINSGAVVEEVFLPTPPPSLVGFHPTRPQFVLANLNEAGDVVIYKEELTLVK